MSDRPARLRARLRLTLLSVLLTFGACTARELIVPPHRQLLTPVAVAGIERYRAHLSPRVGSFIQCRFQPTCSAYGLSAVKKYGGIRGGARALWRIARCGPWTPAGTVDLP